MSIATTTPLAPVAEWPMLRELDSDASQRIFHITMEAFARPGTVHRLPVDSVPATVPAVVVPLLALADIMTPIAAIPSADPAITAEVTAAIAVVARLLATQTVLPGAARFGLAFDEPAELSALNRGSHWSPEAGAMLFQRVRRIDVLAADASAEASVWKLTGPGIKPDAPVFLRVDGLGGRFVAERAERVSDYPAGIDIILVTDEGDIVCLSRTTVIDVVDAAEEKSVTQ